MGYFQTQTYSSLQELLHGEENHVASHINNRLCKTCPSHAYFQGALGWEKSQQTPHGKISVGQLFHRHTVKNETQKRFWSMYDWAKRSCPDQIFSFVWRGYPWPQNNRNKVFQGVWWHHGICKALAKRSYTRLLEKCWREMDKRTSASTWSRQLGLFSTGGRVVCSSSIYGCSICESIFRKIS